MSVKEPLHRQEDDPAGRLHSSRRGFLKGMGVFAGAAVVLPQVAAAQDGGTAAPAIKGLREVGRGEVAIRLRVNGEEKSLSVEPRTTLLEALRDKLDLTGSKEICDRGACGGCTVLLDGKAINSCLMLAIDAEGREILTIEGVARDPRYARLIESYCEHDAAQCGYCIPGFVVRSAEFLAENPKPGLEEIRHGIAGNICRCGTHSKIFDAIAACAGKGGVG